MAFSLGDGDDQGLNEMNLIPLIDIMLVLMIIFLVTATVLHPSVPLSLPKTTAEVVDLPPEVVQISIDKDGKIYWDDKMLTMETLATQLAKEAASGRNPAIHLRADKDGKYDHVAKVLAATSQAGLDKIAFVNE